MTLLGPGPVDSRTAAISTYGVGSGILGLSSVSMDELCGTIMAAQNEVESEVENEVEMRCERDEDRELIKGEIEKKYSGEIDLTDMINEKKKEDMKDVEDEDDDEDDEGEGEEDEEEDEENDLGEGCVTACL